MEELKNTIIIWFVVQLIILWSVLGGISYDCKRWTYRPSEMDSRIGSQIGGMLFPVLFFVNFDGLGECKVAK